MACVIFPRVAYLDVQQGFHVPHVTFALAHQTDPAATY